MSEDDFEALGPPSDDSSTSGNNIPMDVWVPDRAIDMINLEKQMAPELSDEALANKIMKESLPLVALGLVHTAKYSSDVRMRFQAQTYVMDRVLGKASTGIVQSGSPMEQLLKDLMDQVDEVVKEAAEVEA